VPPWFWGWLATSITFALVALVARDRSAGAFATSAVCATVLAGMRAPIWAQWTAFLAISLPLLALAARRWYRRRHGRGASEGPVDPGFPRGDRR
jgi:membrane protein implicated in regulation of membrane protease activity